MDPKKKLIYAIAAAGGLIILFGPAFLRWSELNARQEQLEAEIAYLRKENNRLYQEARRLREDPTYAEAVVRRELGYVRPGETKIQFKKQVPGVSDDKNNQ
jgi:cell division protein FtsB